MTGMQKRRKNEGDQTVKHYIIVKFRDGTDVKAAAVRELFEGTLSIPGIRGVDVRTSCSSLYLEDFHACIYHLIQEMDGL